MECIIKHIKNVTCYTNLNSTRVNSTPFLKQHLYHWTDFFTTEPERPKKEKKQISKYDRTGIGENT